MRALSSLLAPLALLAGLAFVGGSIEHHLRVPGVDFEVGPDLRVTDNAPGVQAGDLLVGERGADEREVRYRSAFDFLLRVAGHAPEERLDFLLDNRGYPYFRPTDLRAPPAASRLVYVGAALVVVFPLCAVLWWVRRSETGVVAMVLACWTGTLALVGYTDLDRVVAARPLALALAGIAALCGPLLLHLSLLFPRPRPWARRPAALLLYLPAAAVAWWAVTAVQGAWDGPSPAAQAHLALALRWVLPAAIGAHAAIAFALVAGAAIGGDPVVRKQVHWVLYGLGLGAAVTLALRALVPGRAPAHPWIAGAHPSLLAAWPVLALSMGFSIARFRLLDLDRIVRRTVVYAALAALAALAYLGSDAALAVLLPPARAAVRPIGAAVLATAIFFLLRGTVQSAVTRVLDSRRLRYARVLEDAVQAALTTLDARSILDRVIEVARRDIGASAAVALVPPGPDAAGDEDARWRVLCGRLERDPPAARAVATLRRAARRSVATRPTGDAPIFDDLGAEAVLLLGDEALVAMGAKESGGLYTADDLELFAHVAERATIALRNAREHQALRDRYRHLEQALAAAQEESRLFGRELRAAAHLGPIVGGSAALRAAMEAVDRAAGSREPALVAGEPGTGKDLVARALHERSPRAARPIVPVDCAALSPADVETELFGRVSLDRAGAPVARRGRVEIAEGGTLLLREVGALPPETQQRIVGLIRNGRFERAGSAEPVRADVRVVATSSRDLPDAVARGRFDEKLLAWLNATRIDVPALRDRRDDIPALADFFLERFARRLGRDVRGWSPAAVARLSAHRWPGNVRELAQVVWRAALTAGPTVEEADLALGDAGPGEALAVEPDLGFHDAVEDFKRRLLSSVVARAGGNQAEAARRLGLQRTYLYRLMKQLGLREQLEKRSN